MGNFATGVHAIALCDRCGQEYAFHKLRQEWNGLKTCPSCFEIKHPQLTPPHHRADAEALPWTRPARREPTIVFVGDSGDSSFESNGMQPSDSIKKLQEQEYKDITHFIMYEDLVNNPEKIINDIYEFLEIPKYTHYFTNLNKFSSNGITYNEDWYLPSKVTIDLHDIRTENISFIKHEKLPENILKLCTI